jgi:hypothetical protein
MLATIASLRSRYQYPVQDLYDAWSLLFLNMDRNTLWGAAGGMVFVNDQSWDVQDRFQWVFAAMEAVLQAAGSALLQNGRELCLFNPLNWKRNDPVVLALPEGNGLDGMACEALPGGDVLCQGDVPSMSVGTWTLSAQPAPRPASISFPCAFETEQYTVRIDRVSGALVSLMLRGTERELLAGPANVVVAERPILPQKQPADHMPSRPGRVRLATSNDHPCDVHATRGPVATTITASGTLYGGGTLRRTIRLYHNHPRIDFETELNDIPDYTVVVAEFPLLDEIREVRRGIPYGFAHAAWARPNPDLHGWAAGTVPAVRWIDFSFVNGGGCALLDQGLSGRELNDRTPLIYLLNSEDTYRGYVNPWLSGWGKHVLPYSLIAYGGEWSEQNIARAAWEYNRGPVITTNRAPMTVQSFLETSSNVIVEAMRREGDHVELRLVESLGASGVAEIKLLLPHQRVTFTDLTGRAVSSWPRASSYEFDIRPQQIVTIHFSTSTSLDPPRQVSSWDAFVPEHKRTALHDYDPTLIGHPPPFSD